VDARLIQKDYVTDDDDDLRISIWEGHRLRAADVKKVLKRTEAFRTDPRLADPVSATCDDYHGSTEYDRGHMAPSGDFTKSLTSMLNSFLLSNMTPQSKNLNEGYWQQFETYVRFWAKEYGTVWVITVYTSSRKPPGNLKTMSLIASCHGCFCPSS
jgi:endonuclease G